MIILEADRDVFSSWNIKLKALKMWICFHESQPMKPEAGRPSATNVESYENSGGVRTEGIGRGGVR